MGGNTGMAGVGRPPNLIAGRWVDRLLALLSALLLLTVLAAVARGGGRLAAVPPLVLAHLASMVLVLALTPLMLALPPGTPGHRRRGRIWAGAILASAIITLFFNVRSDGGVSGGVFAGDWSWIHLLSILVIVQVPRIVLLARRHRVTRHRIAVRTMVAGALLLAGFFTFAPDRLLGAWLLR